MRARLHLEVPEAILASAQMSADAWQRPCPVWAGRQSAALQFDARGRWLAGWRPWYPAVQVCVVVPYGWPFPVQPDADRPYVNQDRAW